MGHGPVRSSAGSRGNHRATARTHHGRSVSGSAAATPDAVRAPYATTGFRRALMAD